MVRPCVILWVQCFDNRVDRSHRGDRGDRGDRGMINPGSWIIDRCLLLERLVFVVVSYPSLFFLSRCTLSFFLLMPLPTPVNHGTA